MVKTSHTILKLKPVQAELLNSICDLYTKAKHTAFQLICKDNYLSSRLNNSKDTIISLSSQHKKHLAQKFNLTGRHINSINIELGMIITSYIAQRDNYLSDLQHDLKQINKSLVKYNKSNDELITRQPILKNSIKTLAKQVNYYQQFIIDNKNKNSKSNKLNNSKPTKFIFLYKGLNLPQIIQNNELFNHKLIDDIDKNLFKATQKYGKNLFQIKILKQNLVKLEKKINSIIKDISQHKLRICFGTKALFKQQSYINSKNNKIKNNHQIALYSEHLDWLSAWYDARSHQFLLTGAGEEVSGNNNCSAFVNDKGLFDIRVRIPDALVKNKTNKQDNYITITDVDFGKNNELLKSSLLSEKKQVRILTVSDKEEIKKIKEQVGEAIKAKIGLGKQIKLAKKAIPSLNSQSYDVQFAELDDKIFSLKEEIKLKSDIFDIKSNISNNVDNQIRTRIKKLAIPITYRFVKNINSNSPKYNTWSLHFTVDVVEPEIITNNDLGTIGIDLNNNHLAVSEIDSQGKLIQAFNIHLNPDTFNGKIDGKSTTNNKNYLNLINTNNNTLKQLILTDNEFKFTEKNTSNLSSVSTAKTQHIMGNALKIITNLALKTGKPIVIEDLNFAEKKKQLKHNDKLTNKGFNYNNMLSSLAYSKFKQLLKSQATKVGVEVVEINPAYSSLIGLVNYVKPLGLSVHMAASYVIAQRGLSKVKDKKYYNNYNKYQVDEKARVIEVDDTLVVNQQIIKNSKQQYKNNKPNLKPKLEIYIKSKVYLLDYIVNSNVVEDKPQNEWVHISNLYKQLLVKLKKEKLQRETFIKRMKELKSATGLSNELDQSYLFSEDDFPEPDSNSTEFSTLSTT